MTFSHHISACLSLHVTTIAIPVAAIPLVLFVYILLLFVSVSVSVPVPYVFSLYQLGADMAGCFFCFISVWILYHFCFRVMASCVDFDSEQPPPPLINYIAFAGVIQPGKDSLYIAHLIFVAGSLE